MILNNIEQLKKIMAMLLLFAISFVGVHVFKVDESSAQGQCYWIGTDDFSKCRRIRGPFVPVDPIGKKAKNSLMMMCDTATEYVLGVGYNTGSTMDNDDIWVYCCRFGG